MARKERRRVLVLLLNVAAVLFMAGFIWTMQLVHYPLFDLVGEEAFPAYGLPIIDSSSWWPGLGCWRRW